MNEPTHFDLVAIGGGFAGLCAAVRGAELGLRTAVLEAGTHDSYLCSSRWAGGIFHVSYHDVKLSPDELLAAINRQTNGETEQQLAAAIATDAGRTVDWLASQGAVFSQGNAIGWHRFALAPPRQPVAGQDWQGRGPDRLLGELRRRLERQRCAWSAAGSSALQHTGITKCWIFVPLRLSLPMAGFPAMPSSSASISGRGLIGC
jgi:fumarate reductase flavoprotein subunit